MKCLRQKAYLCREGNAHLEKREKGIPLIRPSVRPLRIQDCRNSFPKIKELPMLNISICVLHTRHAKKRWEEDKLFGKELHTEK